MRINSLLDFEKIDLGKIYFHQYLYQFQKMDLTI